MIEKAGRILKADSRYAVVQLTNHTHQKDDSFFAKLHTFLFPNHLSHTNPTTVRARNSIYAQPNDTVIVGLSPSHPFNTIIKQTGHCIDTSAIILRCTTSVSENYSIQ